MSSDRKAPPSTTELSLDDLERASGGLTQQLFSNVNLGPNPSHNYGLASDVFGQKLSYQEANTLLQSFNAPTREALYGQGNDPNAAAGTVSRPGAYDLPGPFDHGGNVTLEHGDGYARNTTVDFQHPLQGTITRNLLVDLNEGGGYQVLTLGRGEGGAQLATIAGGVVAGPAGAMAAQNGAHLVNPELGRATFSQLDESMIAHLNGAPNPNINGPQGRGTEAGNMLTATIEGVKSAFGYGQTAHSNDPQTQLAYDVARQLNQTGPVDGMFMKSTLGGVYHNGPNGQTYYERGADGRPVEKPIDDMAGVDAAVARQAARVAAENPPSEQSFRAQEPPAPDQPGVDHPPSEQSFRAQEPASVEHPPSEQSFRAMEPAAPHEPAVHGGYSPPVPVQHLSDAPFHGNAQPAPMQEQVEHSFSNQELHKYDAPVSHEKVDRVTAPETPELAPPPPPPPSIPDIPAPPAITNDYQSPITPQPYDGTLGNESTSLNTDTYNQNNFTGTAFDSGAGGFDSGGFDSGGASSDGGGTMSSSSD